MADYDSLLFPVFNELRRQGVPLGVQDYLLAVRTIREGVGVETPGAFKQLCCLLWAKSREDQERFNVAFAKWVEPQLRSAPEIVIPPANPATVPSISSQQPTQTSSLKETTGSTDKREAEPEKQEVQFALHALSFDWQPLTNISSTYQTATYHLTPRLPIDRREMAGLWRHLRRLRREGTPEELDVANTLQKMCQTGFFLGPVLQPRRHNQASLILLIDQQGSMAPFSLLIDALIESALRGGGLRRTHLFYFHDCPEHVVFERPNLTVVRSLEEVLSEKAKDNCVLIVSDAGAARGYYDGQRVAGTRRFLKILNTYTYLYTWLNPVPLPRWAATTAEDIAGMVPMYHLDREGLNDAIDILRGHPFPSEVSFNV